LVIVPVVFSLFVAISSLATAPIVRPIDTSTERLAQALEPSLRKGVTPGELSPVLAQLIDGGAQLPLPVGQETEDIGEFVDLAGVRRITVLSTDRMVLASAGQEPLAVGQPLDETWQTEWRLTLDQAAASGCVSARPIDGPLPEAAACRMTAADGQVLGTLVVENNMDARFQFGAAIGRVLGITLFGASFTLLLALPVIVPVLLVALGIGALIARQISRRVERLTQAAGDVAAGNYARRVVVDREDELGRLSGDFNAMAAQLEEREQALEAEAARAEAALAANKRLVANVSHELRTPLTTLRGYVEVLEQEHGDRLPQRDLAIIHGEVDRLTGLIEDLFTLARAEAQQLPLVITAVAVKDVVAQVVEKLAPLAQRNRQIELIDATPPDMPAAQADQARLEQVLLNLVQNALRHTPAGGIVAIEAAPTPGGVAITVADTGLGIAPDELLLVFERFYRGDQSRARETGGAGLGLALARELAHAMGGDLHAESTLGRGSRFTITLRRA
ncbi:MAG: HAMP domain-containing protein, partial [Roseiflexaceae bacterium]|nr:HAMP domain-containing protein [Roseiflexaceae bacterium]